jgi:hypothetical protein
VPWLWHRRGLYSQRLVEWHFWISTLGILLYITSMWVSGILQGLDISANFNEAESGAYAAMVRLAPGQWIVQLHSDELSRAGDPVFRLKQRVFVPEAP